MSLGELYNWQAQIREMLSELGYWPSLVLAMYSLGIVLARQSAPSKVAEKLGGMGKPDTVQRRLERFVDNGRINWQSGCAAWSGWVLRRYSGERVILSVNETQLGQHLRVMMVGLAYGCCCVPLGQVALIETLLRWVAPAIPPEVTPLVQADRGIDTSPDLVRVIERLGWQYLFRVQKSVVLRPNGKERSLKHLVNAPGQAWSGTGQVFKKDGWLAATVLVVWAVGYTDFWCLLTNTQPPSPTTMPSAIGKKLASVTSNPIVGNGRPRASGHPTMPTDSYWSWP